MNDSDDLSRRCRIGLRAYQADGWALSQAWRYLPCRLKECYIRSYYVCKLWQAVAENSDELAELLGELYRLGE